MNLSGYYLHARGLRYVQANFDLDYDSIESLILFGDWQEATGRKSGAEQHIVGWSGSKTRWKKRVKKGLALGIQKGLIGQRSRTGGISLFITQKGIRILEAYYARLPEVVREQIEKRKQKERNNSEKIINKLFG